MKLPRRERSQEVVTFKVSNAAQKKWIQENRLLTLEGNLQKKVGASRIRLEVGVIPMEEKEIQPYTDQEKATALMGQNGEVREPCQGLRPGNKIKVDMKLRCENLVKKYGIRTVVKGVSMEINQGEIVGFLGPNGAGKTTSFYMITGQIVPNGGRVYLDDEDITDLPMYKRAQKGIGYLPQEASVFRKMSVEDNIMSVMEMSDMTKEERRERLESLIDEFNLSKVRKSLGIQLSGGERRRCEIARALAIDPKFILLDEPFAGVDPIAVEDIQYIIAKLKYKNIGVIITDHNVGETLAITDRAYLLYEGTILQHGTPASLAADEDVRTKYLGSGFVLKRSRMLPVQLFS